MTISKQLSPVGYLNKMTGHIWTPTEQPNAADEPGLYEPLVLSREAMEVVQQKDALQLSVDNILRGLGITGDGSVTQLVLGKFIAIQAERDALAVDNVALKERNRSNLQFIAEELGDPEFSVESVQTPATEAAIAEIGLKAVEAELNRSPDAEIKWDGTNLTVQNVRDGFGFGVTPVYVAANLRVGRKG